MGFSEFVFKKLPKMWKFKFRTYPESSIIPINLVESGNEKKNIKLQMWRSYLNLLDYVYYKISSKKAVHSCKPDV